MTTWYCRGDSGRDWCWGRIYIYILFCRRWWWLSRWKWLVLAKGTGKPRSTSLLTRRYTSLTLILALFFRPSTSSGGRPSKCAILTSPLSKILSTSRTSCEKRVREHTQRVSVRSFHRFVRRFWSWWERGQVSPCRAGRSPLCSSQTWSRCGWEGVGGWVGESARWWWKRVCWWVVDRVCGDGEKYGGVLVSGWQGVRWWREIRRCGGEWMSLTSTMLSLSYTVDEVMWVWARTKAWSMLCTHSNKMRCCSPSRHKPSTKVPDLRH